MMVGHEFAKAVAGTTARKTASEIDRNMDVSPSPAHAASAPGVGMVQLMPGRANHDDAAGLRQAASGRRRRRHVKSTASFRGNRQIAAKSFDQSGSGGLNGFDIAVRIHKAACLFAAGIEFDLIGFGIDLAR
ncbi:hypothetical protein [Mesorhizobium wenxiniae]|uniref:hypothetical protein n=1 Tax=Mesorhizobium wenxiniae TaxID=2014805 RepID=UPI0013FDE334|nr:hypothetical protein [Mesorhizobium wenxiniae]